MMVRFANIAVKKLCTECSKNKYRVAGVHFGNDDACSEFLYDTNIDATYFKDVPFSQWDKTHWDAFIARGIKHHKDQGLFVDRVQSVVLVVNKNLVYQIII